MKPRKVLLITAALVMATGAYAQRANRGDVCRNIPNLSTEQTQQVSNLSVIHKKTMDGLREQFYSEIDAAKASEYKTQMNTEMANHYRNISDILTPEQKTWFDQQCNVNNRRGYYRNVGFGRGGQGYGRGLGYASGQGYGRGVGYASGQGYGRGVGYASGQGYGRGQGRGRGMGRGMGRATY